MCCSLKRGQLCIEKQRAGARPTSLKPSSREHPPRDHRPRRPEGSWSLRSATRCAPNHRERPVTKHCACGCSKCLWVTPARLPNSWPKGTSTCVRVSPEGKHIWKDRRMTHFTPLKHNPQYTLVGRPNAAQVPSWLFGVQCLNARAVVRRRRWRRSGRRRRSWCRSWLRHLCWSRPRRRCPGAGPANARVASCVGPGVGPGVALEMTCVWALAPVSSPATALASGPTSTLPPGVGGGAEAGPGVGAGALQPSASRMVRRSRFLRRPAGV